MHPLQYTSSGCGPYLEFQCIECVFGGAAQRPLNIHIQWVEQLVALGLQGTAHLYGGRVHWAGAVVDQLQGRDISGEIKKLFFFFYAGLKLQSLAAPRRVAGAAAQRPAPPSDSAWDSSWEEERRSCLGGKHYKCRQKFSSFSVLFGSLNTVAWNGQNAQNLNN